MRPKCWTECCFCFIFFASSSVVFVEKSKDQKWKKNNARIKVFTIFNVIRKDAVNDLFTSTLQWIRENGLNLKTKPKYKLASYKFIVQIHGNLDSVTTNTQTNKMSDETGKKSSTLVLRLAICESPMFFLSGKCQ